MEPESTWLFIYHAGETISLPADQLPGVDVWAIKASFDAFLAGTGPELVSLEVPGMAAGTIQLSKVTAMIVRPNGGDPSIKKVELLGATGGCSCPCQHPTEHFPSPEEPQPLPEGYIFPCGHTQAEHDAGMHPTEPVV